MRYLRIGIILSLMAQTTVWGMFQAEDFPTFRKKVNSLWVEKKFDEAIEVYWTGLEKYPDHAYSISRSLINMCLQVKKQDKCFEILEWGHNKSYFYPLYLKSGPFADLMANDRFKKIAEKNADLTQKAQAKTQARYDIKIPEGYDKSKKYPVFMVLHGWSGGLGTLQASWKSQRLEEEFITVYIQSSQIIGQNMYAWDNPETSYGDLKKCLTHLKSNYAMDTEKIVIAGFSQGAKTAIDSFLLKIVPAIGFIAHCPGGGLMDEINRTHLREVVEKDNRGVIFTGEIDHSKEDQKNLMALFNEVGFACKYIEIPELGHWFPEDFPKRLDRAISYLLEGD